jgi:putative addiction module component (TIGR02574 family)
MTATVEDLAQQATQLTTEDRSRLVELLLASLPDDEAAAAEAAWDEEVLRRMSAVNAGTARTVSAEDVHAAARRLYER